MQLVMKKTIKPRDSEIEELFDEETKRFTRSKPVVPVPNAFTFINHDSFCDEEDQAYVDVFARMDGGRVVRRKSGRRIPDWQDSEEEL